MIRTARAEVDPQSSGERLSLTLRRTASQA